MKKNSVNREKQVLRMKAILLGFLFYNMTSMFGTNPDSAIFTVNDMKSIDMFCDLASNFSEDITYQEMIDYIDNSSLDDYHKKLFKNEKLLKDLEYYYNASNMNYAGKLKLKDINITYYEKDKTDPSMYGYYQVRHPNKLYIRDDLYVFNKDDTEIHEYIHLLQAMSDYYYITEASAEIIKYEYFADPEIDSYYDAVSNVRLLMEIVGPVPIWKINFSGDSSDLEQFLQENLSKEKTHRLLKLLKTKPDDFSLVDSEIKKILFELYENVYQEKAVDSDIVKGIYLDELIERYYFNSEQILKNKDHYRTLKEVKLDSYYIIKNPLSYEKYLSYLEMFEIYDHKGEIIFETEGVMINDGVVYEDTYYTAEEAINKGIVKVYYEQIADYLYDEQIELYLEEGRIIEKVSLDSEDRYAFKYETTYIPNIYEKFPEQKIKSRMVKDLKM